MKNSLAILVTGVCTGVFLGLSESPILSQVLSPIIVLIIGLLSVLTGQNDEAKPASLAGIKNPLPIMWIMVGMLSGSILGLLAKNYDIFSPSGKQTPSDVSSISIISQSESTASSSGTGTVLHGKTEDICGKNGLCSLSGYELLCAVKDLGHPEIEQYLDAKKDSINLLELKHKIQEICNCQN